MIFNTDVNEKSVTMRRGNWYLTAPAQLQPMYDQNGIPRSMYDQNGSPRHSSIIHCCNPFASTKPTVAFPIDYLDHARFNRTKPTWRCTCCYKKPPKDILTVFVLQNWDWVSEEVQKGF